MKELAFRLSRGADLRDSLEEICSSNGIDTAAVVSGVGCVSQARIRLAKAADYLEKKQDYEIVSLTGTISRGQAHIHIALADDKGEVIGGHLLSGCLINTTCEVILAIMEEYSSHREYDEQTGYDEIVFTKKEGRLND